MSSLWIMLDDIYKTLSAIIVCNKDSIMDTKIPFQKHEYMYICFVLFSRELFCCTAFSIVYLNK